MLQFELEAKIKEYLAAKRQKENFSNLACRLVADTPEIPTQVDNIDDLNDVLRQRRGCDEGYYKALSHAHQLKEPIAAMEELLFKALPAACWVRVRIDDILFGCLVIHNTIIIRPWEPQMPTNLEAVYREEVG